MSKARLVVTAVTVEKRPVSEVARTYGVARSWIYTLLARYRTEGEAAFEPRSRRPKTSPNAISPDAVELIIRLRKELAGQGLDAGPDTIAWHLHHHHHITVSRATISRYLTAHGLIVPEPKKRPRSSYIRFEASQPNECWQSDFTHYPLADGTDTEILSWLDDHSRYALSVTAWSAVTGPIVVESFRAAVTAYGIPASTLTDNGMVFTTRLAGRERRPQRLRTRAAPPARGPEELPPQPPHHQNPPPSISRDPGTHPRIRHDRIDDTGVVTLRVAGKLRHIGIGRTHARTHIIMLINDLHVRVVNAATGELLRELTIDLTRDYQPTGRPPGPKPK